MKTLISKSLLKKVKVVLLLAVVSGASSCATPGATGPGAISGEEGAPRPNYQFKELRSDLSPVYLKNLERTGTSFMVRSSDPVVVNAITDGLQRKGMVPSFSPAEATFIIETRPGFVGAFKDYRNAPQFANEIGAVAATATNAGLLFSRAAGYGRAAAAADLAGTFITLVAKAAEHANTPNIFLGEIEFKITERLPVADETPRKGRKDLNDSPSAQIFEHEGMFRTSVSGVGLVSGVGIRALSTHMGELVAGIF